MSEWVRDEGGPDHSPKVFPSRIVGVIAAESPNVVYKDGLLAEHYRAEWAGVFQKDEPIVPFYTIQRTASGPRNEWYFHRPTESVESEVSTSVT